MKKSRKLVGLIVAILSLVGIVAVGCGDDKATNKKPSKPTTQSEWGVYYYDYNGSEYLLSLADGNKVTVIMGNTVATGTYSRKDKDISFKYGSQGIGAMSATINADNSAITLTYNDVPMQFLRRVIYNVTFNTNSGSDVADVEVLNGKSFSKPSDPVRAGYTFLGWYKDNEYKTPFIFESDIVSADTTLFAQWGQSVPGENVYTVKFDVGEYEGAVNPQPKQTVGGKVYGLETPVRSGYTFVGWWYSVTGKPDELTYHVDKDTVFNESTTLYAVWQGAREGNKLLSPAVSVEGNHISWHSVANAVQYTVRIDGRLEDAGKEFEQINRVVTENYIDVDLKDAGEYTITVTAISSSGATYNSEPTVRTYKYNPLARVSLFNVVSDTVLWNAVDNAEKYILNIDCGNERHEHSAFDNGKSTYFSLANCEMQRGGIKFTVTAVADGYTSSTSEEYVYSKDLDAVPTPYYNEETQTVSWQAVPNATNYEITLVCDTLGHTHTQLDVGLNTSYSVKECEVPEGGLMISVTPRTKGYNSPDPTTLRITAEQKSAPATPRDIRIVETTLSWSAVEADKYVVRIGDKEIETTTNSIDLSKQEVSWTQGSDYQICVRAVKGEKASAWSDAADARYYAMFSTLSYNKNTVSWRHVIGATKYEVRVNEGVATTVADGTNSAKVKLTKAGENKIEVRFFSASADGKTLTPSAWAPLNVTAYSLTYDTRGGAAATGVSLTQYYAVGDELALPKVNDITKEGYTLGDMYTTPGTAEGNSARFTDKTYTALGDTVLYASWVPNTYKIKLNYNNGGTGVAEMTVTYGKPFRLPTPDTITDGTTVFGGWCANTIGTGAAYTDEKGAGIGVWKVAGDTEVYAAWWSVFVFNKTRGGSAGFYYVVKANAKAVREVPAVTVPSTYKTVGDAYAYPVTQLAKDAFDSCLNVQEINLPNTLDTIPTRMFEGESKKELRAINVYQVTGGSDTYFSDNGVLYYNNSTAGTVDLWVMPRAKTGVYTLNSRTNTIPTRTLAYSGLNELKIPASVTYIANDAFYYNKIPTITFLSPAAGEQATALRLESGALNNSSVTTKIVLPARDIVVWDSANSAPIANPDFNIDVFVNCSALTTIEVDPDNTYFQSIDGLLCSKGADATLLYCPKDRGGALTIPTGIVKIGRRAFSGCRKITKVIIPNWVNEIEEEAFTGYKVRLPGATSDTSIYGCTALTNVTFKSGDGVAADLVIGRNAFGSRTETASYFCSNLTTIEFQKGSGVAEIGDYAFARCPITKIVLPASLSEVKEGAFYSCDKLQTVEYAPNGKDIAIGDLAFANCTSFTTVKLPANITKFEGGAFAGCANLANIEVDSKNKVLTSVDGVLFSKDKTEILFYPFGKEGNYQIPSTVTKIGGGAFSGKANITEITISKNITEIGAGAFRNCSELEKVTFEPGGTAELIIGDSAFNYCQKLTSFKLPDRVKKIPARMLFYAKNLKQIYIPSEVTSIGDYAFYYVGQYTYSPTEFIGKIVIPAAVHTIGIGAFAESTITEVEFEDKKSGDITLEKTDAVVESNSSSMWLDEYRPFKLGEDESRLFYNCKWLTKATLPDGLKALPAKMFESCVKLTEVNIPGTVTEMGYVFMNCSSLVTVKFDERAVGEDGKVVPLVLQGGSERNTSTSGAPSMVYEGVFASCSSLKNITLPEGLTRIPSYCFYGCTSLEKIEIPSTVQNGDYTPGETQLTAIGNKAFASCSSLYSVTFAKGGTGDLSLGDNSFASCTELTSITLPARFADSHVNAGGRDRVVCGVRVGYQSGDASYSYYSPSLSANIAEINIEDGCAGYSSDDGILYNADKTELVYVPRARTKEVKVLASVNVVKNFAFYNNIGVKKVTFLERTTSNVATQAEGDDESEPTTPAAPTGLVIGEGALKSEAGAFYTSKVEEIYFPKHLQKITQYAFHSTAKLWKIEFAEGTTGFTEIERDAFNTTISYISTLRSVTLPDCVTTIGDRAFRSNGKLETFTVSENSKLTSIGSEAFYGTAISEIYVPAAQSVSIGSGAFSNCPQLTTVHIPNTVTSFDGLFAGSYALAILDIYTVKDEQGNDVQGALTSDKGVIYVDNGKTLSYYPIGKKDTSYTIPVGVTKIAAGAFMSNGYLEEVYIPNTVELVLDKAFYMMSALKKVVFESDTVNHYVQLTEAEKESYTGDRYVKQTDGTYVLTTDKTADAYKLLPKNPLKIGVTVNANTGAVSNSAGSTSTGVFSFCQSLEVVNLPTRLEHISGYSFYFCINLHTVTFDAGCKLGIIQKCLFANTALQYGGTREEIENDSNHPFALPAQMTEFADGSTTADENRPFGKVTKLVIPSGVNKVGNYAFYGSEYLQEVEFTGAYSKQITTVGTNMFKQCSQLTTVIMPNKITTISTNMFQDCPNLKVFATEKPASGTTPTGEITLPKDVTRIDGSAFSGCKGLTKVILPASGLTTINGSAFLNCTNLAKITYDDTNTEYDLYLPSSATTLSASAFAGTAITSAYIPKVSTINLIFGSNQEKSDGTAVLCKNLKKVVFGNDCTFTTLSNYMFLQLTSLEEVELPTSTKFNKIGIGAFCYTSLKRITIPASVTTIDRSAFANCPYLEKVEFVEDDAVLTINDGTRVANVANDDGIYILNSDNYKYYGAFAFSGYKNGRAEAKAKAEAEDATDADKEAYANNFKIDLSGRKTKWATTVWETINGVRQQVTYTYAISPFTFYQLGYLDVVLGNSEGIIGNAAFQGAKSETFTIPASITTINLGAFSDSKIKTIKFAASEAPLTFVTGNAAISNSTTITCSAFVGCSELTSVDMSERKITEIPQYTFYNCPKISEIKWSVSTPAAEATETEPAKPMVSHTTAIGDYAFQHSFATTMTTLNLPEGLETIGVWAFNDTPLKTVTFPSTLTSIGERAFSKYQAREEYTGLTCAIVIPGKVTTIGDYAFADTPITGLTFATYKKDGKDVSDITTLNRGVFWGTMITEVTIPASMETIGRSAFYNSDLLTSVKFAPGCKLTTIDPFAFRGTGLTTVNIPNSVTKIDNYAFAACPDLKKVMFDKDDDGNCNLTYIGKSAFQGTALKKVNIPKSVTEIGNDAFYNIPSLTLVEIDKDGDGNCNLTTIGDGAFKMTAIPSFEIPKSVTLLNGNPFKGIDTLTSLTVEEGNEEFAVENNVIYSADKSVLYIYLGGDGAFTLPNDVVEIADYAFAGSNWSGALNVSLSGFTIGVGAFDGCDVTSVTLADGVTIGSRAFAGNPNLVSVTVGENVVIGESAFANCDKLSLVNMGNGATIGFQAFADDEALTALAVPDGATVDLTAFSGTGVTLDEQLVKEDTVFKYAELGAYIDGTLVFSNVADAAAALRAYSNLENVELAEGITSIGNNAFDGITNLKKIILPSTLRTIGGYAFRNCTSLAEVVFNKDEEGNTALNEIGIYSFANTAIAQIVIPKSVTIFRYYAFNNCAKLTRVEFEKGSGVTIFYANGTGAIGTTSDARHFANCPLLETVVLPERATFIPATMFENSGITHISIPASVTKIYKNAFLNCAKLETVTFEKNENGITAITDFNESAFMNSGITSITIPASVITVGTKAFQGCASLTTVTFEKNDDGSCAFAYTGGYAFAESGLTSISLPKSYTGNTSGTTAAQYLFYNCKDLQSVIFEKDENRRCAITQFGGHMFDGSGITSITIPSTVVKIGTNTPSALSDAVCATFRDCKSLESVTFEKDIDGKYSITSIYNWSFAGCTSLTEIAFPYTLTGTYGLYLNAFENCTNLTSVTWDVNESGNSSDTWLNNAFSGCAKLKNFIVGNSVKLSNNAFLGWGSDRTIYVVGLPGPNTTWYNQRWLTGCNAKWVWYWSPEKGFLNEDGKFENEVNNPENGQNAD